MQKILLTILFALGITLLHADTATPADDSEPITFTLTNTEGEEILVTELEEGLKFEKYQGRAVFLTLFGHMCPPCNAEIPELIALTEEYPEKLAIVAIEAQQYSDEELKKFKEQKKINYNLVAGKDHEEFIGYLANRAEWNGSIPLLIAIDKNGAVQAVQPGFIPKASLEEWIKTLNQ